MTEEQSVTVSEPPSVLHEPRVYLGQASLGSGADSHRQVFQKMLPGPEDALDILRQAEESRLAGVPGVPIEVMLEELERIVAKKL
jgi:hypothetical protein